MSKPTAFIFIENITKRMSDFVDDLLRSARAIKDVESWDGAASNYADTEAYCGACLIDVNGKLGLSGADMVQANCKLPVKDVDGDYVSQAIHAAAAALAGGRGGLAQPDGLSDDDWNAALADAANQIISLYGEMQEQAPDSIYELAGKQPPKSNSVLRAQTLENIFSKVIDAGYEKYPLAYMSNVYYEGSALFAIFVHDGKLYKSAVVVDADDHILIEDWQEVKAEFTPVTTPAPEGEAGGAGNYEPVMLQKRSQVNVYRTTEGKWRWLASSCTAVVNRVGEIDSKALFDSFVAHLIAAGAEGEIKPGEGGYARATPASLTQFPFRDFFHLGEVTRLGQCDFVAREGNVLITGGEYNDSPLAQAEVLARQADPIYWGDSIYYTPSEAPAFLEVAAGVTIPVYRAGTLQAITTLPEQMAAALYTGGVVTKEVSRMNEVIFQALLKLYNGDEAKARAEAARIDGTNRAIETKGQIARAAGAAQPAATKPATPPATTPAAAPEQRSGAPVFEMDDAAVTAITEAIMARPDMQGLVGALPGILQKLDSLSTQVSAATTRQQTDLDSLTQRVDELARTDEQKRQEWQDDLPSAARTRVTYRPREARNPERSAVTAGGAGDQQPEDYSQIANKTLSNFKKK